MSILNFCSCLNERLKPMCYQKYPYTCKQLLRIPYTIWPSLYVILPAGMPPASCLQWRNSWTILFIWLTHQSGSLCIFLGSRHSTCLTSGYLRGDLSCSFTTTLTRPCKHSFLKASTDSSPTLQPGLLKSSYQMRNFNEYSQKMANAWHILVYLLCQ